MKLDLHSHSHFSFDAISKPETIIKIAQKRGLTIAITDHDNCNAWPELKLLSKLYKVDVIFGQEIKTFQEEKFVGELIGLFLTEEIKSKNFFEVIEEIHSQGGIVSVPHPFDYFRSNFKMLDLVLKKIDLFEVFNARCWLPSFNDKANFFLKKHSLIQSAGSDAHTPQEFGNAFLEINAISLEEARKKLLKGNSKVFGKNAGLIPHIKTFLAKSRLLKEQ